MSKCLELLVICLLLTACRGESVQQLDGRTMGTTWSVQVVAARGQDLRAAERVIASELERVDAQMSTWRADSDISRYNEAAAGSRQPLPTAFAQVLRAAIEVADASGGAFDPTIGPLVRLWGFGLDGRTSETPDAGAIATVRARVGWQRLNLDAQQRLLQPGGVELDLSSIAKGHAVDRIAEGLEAAGYRAFLVEIGGELRGRGAKPDGSAWRIAIESPMQGGGEPLAVLELDDGAVATSGDYRNHYVLDGLRHSHLIDPRSGAPVAHAGLSVTVVHDSCMWADAWATALHVLGPEQGMALAEEHGLAVLMLADDGDRPELRVSQAFRSLSQPD